MFNITKKDKRTNLEKEMEAVLSVMSTLPPDSEEYAKIAKQYELLAKVNQIEKPRSVSPDTLATIAGNLLGIGMILTFEQGRIITSKALGFVIKGRV